MDLLVDVLQALLGEERVENVEENEIVLKTTAKEPVEALIRIRLQLECNSSKYSLSMKYAENGWMEREDFDCLSLNIIQSFQTELETCASDDVGSIVDVIARCLEAVQEYQFACSVISNTTVKTPIPDQDQQYPARVHVRMWLKLISLSTKEKRDDLVNWGRDAGFTGFVMAGKPGLLCFEAPSESEVDKFMSRIKTTSWSDIPAVQKKISIVLVERIDERAFQDLQEITHIFSMGGFLENKPDMAQIRDYLTKNNVGHAFEQILL